MSERQAPNSTNIIENIDKLLELSDIIDYRISKKKVKKAKKNLKELKKKIKSGEIDCSPS